MCGCVFTGRWFSVDTLENGTVGARRRPPATSFDFPRVRLRKKPCDGFSFSCAIVVGGGGGRGIKGKLLLLQTTIIIII